MRELNVPKMTGTRLEKSSRQMASANFTIIVVMLAPFVGLYLILPPSLVLPVVSSLTGLLLALFTLRRGHAFSPAVFLSLALVTVLLSTLVFFLTRPVSVGTVASEPLAQEIEALLQNNAFSGAVLIAGDNQILLSKGYGYADRSRMIANTPQTRFRVGSVTKQFTAMAILILQARSQLNVEDPICQYLSDCPTMWQSITIHHLLTHSAGIGDYVALCFSDSERVQQAVQKARNEPLLFEPGTRFSYSNIGYRLLGEIVERVSGQRYGDFLRDNIFVPLRMTRTAFDNTQSPGLAVGYTNALFPACPVDISTVRGEGGIVSSVEDLYLWDRALDTEQLIPRSLLNSMFTVHVPMASYPNLSGGAGYGWGVGKQWGHSVQNHAGSIFGYMSVVARFPDDRMTVIILSNQQTYDESIYSLVTRRLLTRD